MPSLTLNISFSINSDVIFSPSELQNLFLSGIPLSKKDGTTISKQEQELIISSAQSLVEKMLGIIICKKGIFEDRNYEVDDFTRWLNLRTSYPVSKPIYLKGMMGEVTHITYPKEWLSCKKGTIKGQRYRNIALVPNGGGNTQLIASYGGFFPIAFTRYTSVPNYWRVAYITGFEPNNNGIDPLIISAIGKIASINLLNIASDFIIGPGLVGTSLSIDGLSQNISTAKSSGSSAYSPRITQYLTDLKEQIIPVLKSYYKGFIMTSA